MKWMLISAILAAGVFPASAVQAQQTDADWYIEAGLTNPEIGNIAAGWRFHRNFSLEAGYRRVDDEGVVHGPGGRQELNGIDGFEMALRGEAHITERFAVTGRVGLVRWKGDTLGYNPDTAELLVHERSDTAAIGGIGVRYDLSPSWALTAEFAISDAFSASGFSTDTKLSFGLRVTF
jgi:opacity protein-like surface antigen